MFLNPYNFILILTVVFLGGCGEKAPKAREGGSSFQNNSSSRSLNQKSSGSGSKGTKKSGLKSDTDVAKENLEIEYYEVEGISETRLLRSLQRNTPIRIQNEPYFGFTTWAVDWNYEFTENEGMCQLKNIEVDSEVTYTLPKWTSRSRADQDLTQKWDTFYEALLLHEKGHKKFADDAKAEIETTLQELEPSEDCDSLGILANGQAEAIIGEQRKKEQAYDLTTDHGKKTGAVFP